MAARILKLLCVFFSVLTVLLCGCEHDKKSNAVNTDFIADFKAHYRGMELSGTLINNRRGYCAIELSSPETLDGLSVSYSGNELALSRSGVKATADEAYLPNDSFCSILHQILKNTPNGSGSSPIKLDLSCGNADLTVDNNGLPKEASAQSLDFSITFSNAKATGK